MPLNVRCQTPSRSNCFGHQLLAIFDAQVPKLFFVIFSRKGCVNKTQITCYIHVGYVIACNYSLNFQQIQQVHQLLYPPSLPSSSIRHMCRSDLNPSLLIEQRSAMLPHMQAATTYPVTLSTWSRVYVVPSAASVAFASPTPPCRGDSAH